MIHCKWSVSRETADSISFAESNNILSHSNIQPSDSFLSKVFRLLAPVGGGIIDDHRAQLHAAGAVRKFTDPLMWTHIFFAVGSVAAYINCIWDLFILNSVTMFLSAHYHKFYEKPGRIAKIEGTAAKALFLYGSIQILCAPTNALRIIELLLFSLTIAVFFITNLRKELYNSWHFLMHIFPPIWVTIVALYHKPLITF
jgi:hypothetical protein